MYDEDERPSAEQALQHPFLRIRRRGSIHGDVKTLVSARKSLKHLEMFNSQHSKLKQATCAIMASQLLSQEEKDHSGIDNVFRSLDSSCDGQLDKDDLRRSYKEYFDVELSEKRIDTIFEQVNFSASGVIEYSEFAIAIMMSMNRMDENKLRAAFNVFDTDGKEYISADDIKRVLQLRDEQDGYLRKKIMRQVDPDETGKIDFEAFKRVMQSNSSLRRVKRRSIKRDPRRQESPKVDLKEVLGASLLDASFLDTCEMLGSPNSCNQEGPLVRVPNPGEFLEGLEELDEDNSSGRFTRGMGDDASQSSW
jgi:Ca2+-binding EF-hand superfamily protein